MLTMKAKLERKPTELTDLPLCQIEKIIELPGDEFASLAAHPYTDRDYITENRDLMGEWDGKYHCLLALGEGGSDGILIEAEGAPYVRYGAYVSHARDYVERELQRIAELFLKEVSPDPETGEISIYLEDIEEYTGAEVRDDSEIARMFYRILERHPAVAGVDTMDDCLVVTPAAAQEQGASDGLKLRDVLLLGGMENVYMVHETIDVGFVPASYTAMMTDKGREEHADLLNAPVKEIRPGAYGPEIVLGGVDPELLVNFDRAAAAHERAESMMGPTL